MSPDEAAAQDAVRAEVSGPTFNALLTFVALCSRWGARVNLVGAADRDRLWRRHVLDSLQLVPLATERGPAWIDLGSGGGFPGMVVALAREGSVTLVESNRKKAAFLIAAAAETGANVTVEPRRIEALPPARHDVVSARALAPLRDLLTLSTGFFGAGTLGLYPKGREAANEVNAARSGATFEARLHASRTDPAASIVAVTNLGGSDDRAP